MVDVRLLRRERFGVGSAAAFAGEQGDHVGALALRPAAARHVDAAEATVQVGQQQVVGPLGPPGQASGRCLQGIEARRLVAVGDPRSNAARLVPPERLRADLCSDLRLEPGRPLIVMVSKYVSLLFSAGEKEAFYRTVHDAVSAVGGLEVVVKVHPNEDVALLRRQISEWGWPDARLTKEYDIHRLFGAADAAVMVTSMAGIEAMAMGCPVIAVQTPGKDFEGGGMPAYVSEGAVERVDMGDAKALATVLRRLVTDRSARAALVYRGRRFAAPYLHPVDGALADRLQGVVDQIRRELTAGGAQAPGDGSREGRS